MTSGFESLMRHGREPTRRRRRLDGKEEKRAKGKEGRRRKTRDAVAAETNGRDSYLHQTKTPSTGQRQVGPVSNQVMVRLLWVICYNIFSQYLVSGQVGLTHASIKCVGSRFFNLVGFYIKNYRRVNYYGSNCQKLGSCIRLLH